jgi:hypothetical protein
MRGALVLVMALALLVPLAAAQDPWVYVGGEPGVRIVAGETPVDLAQAPGDAIVVDPSEPLALSISLAPPAGESWELRAISVGLLVNGPDSEPPELLVRRMETRSSIPAGWTVVVNRTADLSALERVGAGTFLMQAQVQGEGGALLYENAFYVRVPASLATLLTVQGAAIAAVSVATGYGFWQVAKDIKELRDAWDRHRKKKELARLDVIGRAEQTLERVAEKGGKPLASAVSMHRAVQAGEKQLRPVRWSATGLGLGGVAVAWLQFLGVIAFDGLDMLVVALEAAAVALTLALLANYLLRRARTKPSSEAAAAETVRVPVQGPMADPVEEAPHNRD